MKSDEFARVFQKAQRSSDRYFTVLTRSNQLGRPRLGLAISKKSARRAVDRNRIKRVIRESFRANREQLRSVDVVVLSKSGIAEIEGTRLNQLLCKHWQSS